MASDSTFEIYGRVYPMIQLSEFRFSEWALVREVTGLSSSEFAAAHDEDGGVDKLVVFGYAAVAFWRGNARMTRARAKLAIEDWGTEDVVFVPAEDEAGDAADPPAEAGEGSPSNEDSSQTSSESTDSQGSPSDETNPNDSGNPGSDTGSPA